MGEAKDLFNSSKSTLLKSGILLVFLLLTVSSHSKLYLISLWSLFPSRPPTSTCVTGSSLTQDT